VCRHHGPLPPLENRLVIIKIHIDKVGIGFLSNLHNK
jgi:hypothetical protein